MLPSRIQEMFENFNNWLRSLSNDGLCAMLDDLGNYNVSRKEFVSQWGHKAIPFYNWKKDLTYKEMKRRRLL